ncbi:acetylxylan esterase [Sphingomonas azotifigens]|uniref:acetylxylan esterase n=1 Tax=Sphingomonas azotifigens TaxID=330920 RepID=UPI0009FFE2E0|nr:acetylxylan esterase [Sphingomonas azotifigens]
MGRSQSAARCCAIALALGAPSVLHAQTAGMVEEKLPPPTGLAPYFTPASADPIAPDADGFLRRWLLLEPVVKPNRTNTGFTPSYVRAAIAPATYPGKFDGVPRDGDTAPGALRWHALDSGLFDVKLFYLAQGLGKPTYGVIFWAVTVVNAPREMRGVRLATGSNSASRWWLNGSEVAGLYGDRRMVMDDVLSRPITLRKGRNVLRGAVINGPGLSDFCARFVDEAGKPIRDIMIDVK